MNNFVNLHNYTCYSFYYSLIKPKDLFLKAKELNQSSIALTDLNTMFAMHDCLKLSKETGVKLIAGCELNFVNNLQDPQVDQQRIRHVILLAKNHVGYKNLLKLLRLSNDYNLIAHGRTYPRIDWSLLEQYSEGLICTTSGATGILGQLINTRNNEEALKQAKRLKDIFGENLGFEIQPHAMIRQSTGYSDFVDQTLTTNTLIKFSKELNVKVFAASEAHYLKPEDSEIFDVFLAMGSKQPLKSGQRIRFLDSFGNILPEFYLKSREQVEKFFKRLYPRQVTEWCDNTLYFDSLCETPEWIDPKYSNPSGKELPEFPVHQQSDYQEFLTWKQNNFQDLSDESAYIKYKAYTELEIYTKDFNLEEKKKYKDRVDLELDVYDQKNINGYIEIVAEYSKYCDDNGIPRGPGRGCVASDTMILTENGFKPIIEIKKGDKVYTHTGKLQTVLDTFEYDINEECLEFKSCDSFLTLKMTKDHKVYRGLDKQINKIWTEAKKLNPKDYIYSTLPIRDSINNIQFKLFDFCSKNSNYIFDVKNDKILYKIYSATDPNSINKLAKKSKLHASTLLNIRNNKCLSRKSTLKKLNDAQLTLSDLNLNNYVQYSLNNSITIDEDWAYLLGRWVGDGCFIGSINNRKGIQIAFHKKDLKGIEKISSILKRIGLNFGIYESKIAQTTYINISQKIIYNLFKYFFPDYQNSYTKHLPLFFRKLPNNILKILLEGLFDSDGFKSQNSKTQNIKITSKRLALEIKELLLFLGIKSSIYYIPPKFGVRNCHEAFHVAFNFGNYWGYRYDDTGYSSIIYKISQISLKKVYDIKVENDASYLTSNGVIHNSGGGSLVNFLLGIHKADPIKYDLIFERFFNKQKSAMPDIDMDFSKVYKKDIEQYLSNKYGSEKTANISNILTLTPRPFVRAISRVFQYGGDFKTAVAIGNALAETIPNEFHTMDEVIKGAPLFMEYTKKYPELLKYKELSNLPITCGKHAGGVVIGRRPLSDIVPVRRDKDGYLVLEYEKERAEENGLLKMDILGLETLDIIHDTENFIRKNGKHLDKSYCDYNQYDPKVYDLISNGDTSCVFQLGTSGGTIDLCRKVKPKSIEDISIINSLARPAVAEIRQEFIDTKDGKKPIELLHPKLERAFKSTFGFGLYEESLMYLAVDVGGWSLNAADNLRKLTKDKGKHPEKVAQWRKEFIEGAIKNNVSEKDAIKIWSEVVENFGGYGFNHSHSIMYSLISYRTAWLKAHYPLEFLSANLIAESNSAAKDAPDNVLKIKQELRKLKITIVPPDINKSDATYSIIDEKTILCGFDSIKHLGSKAIPDVLEKRKFTSFQDFILRTEGRKLTSAGIQGLAACGALDCFGMSRKQMFLFCKDYRLKLKTFVERNPDKDPQEFIYPFPEGIGEWSIPELHALEKKYLGEGLSGTPFEVYPGFFDSTAVNFKKLKADFPETGEKAIEISSKYGNLQGIIENFFEFKIKKETSKLLGQMMAKLIVRDPFGNSVSCTLFPQTLSDFKKRLKDLCGNKIKIESGVAIHFSGAVDYYEGEMNITFRQLKKIAGLPALPKSLESQSVKMKITGTIKKKKSKKNVPEVINLIEEFDESLVEQGLSEDINEIDIFTEEDVLKQTQDDFEIQKEG